jgi:hypothetical protein
MSYRKYDYFYTTLDVKLSSNRANTTLLNTERGSSGSGSGSGAVFYSKYLWLL